MAKSTAIVVAAGGLALGELVLTQWEPTKGVKIMVGTVLASLASAGLDKVAPGFGTGAAVLLLMGAVLTKGPIIVKSMGLDKQ